QREYGLAINFLPVWFKPKDENDLCELESINELPVCSISKARWANGTDDGIKKPNELSATLLLKVNDPDVANDMIVKELRVKGKRCPVTKQIQEPLTCFHCQGIHHTTHTCPQIEGAPTCGNCGGEHRTKGCPNPDKKHCTRCNSDDHASRDRECPKFKQAWESMNKRSLTNTLPFFPTEKDWT
ncbi:hypothetical protein K435DRAFT_624025, partial [Dendrothele bispora CBS 962.96]